MSMPNSANLKEKILLHFPGGREKWGINLTASWGLIFRNLLTEQMQETTRLNGSMLNILCDTESIKQEINLQAILTTFRFKI